MPSATSGPCSPLDVGSGALAENYTPCVRRLLLDVGCPFVRQGKGDHEIWYSPNTRRHFMVDAKIKSKLWANTP